MSINCLAEAIYFEARGENKKGQYAIAEVIYNRTKHRAFPNTTCNVINQKGQFVYARRSMRVGSSRNLALKIATEFINGKITNFTNGALYFHNKNVKPRWKKTKTVTIGNHVFYK